jgi:endonuclease/exonuclease/phosphatase family metal-dependent hydrolase
MILAAIAASLLVSQSAPVELKVMTYNIRYGTANDGENAWPKRKEALIGMIQKHNPDVLGVQEALAGQIDELKAALPEHELLGVGRDDGIRKGEYSAIFTRHSKLGLREGGTRWISDDPLKPGTLAFDAKITRIVTWGEFFTVGGKRILLMNAHFDHQSPQARLLGGRQMRAFADQRQELPALVMGDFNSSSTDEPIKALMAGDRFKNSMPKVGPYGTFNGFKPEQVNGDMIDHILSSSAWEVSDVEIDRTLVNGRTPSDHFPVIARFKLKNGAKS